MTALSTHILLLSALLFNVCLADIVLVSVNDSSLVTVPDNIWNGTDYHPDCGGIRWIWGNGTSVSLAFSGQQVWIDFIYDVNGGVAQIVLDGNVTMVDTNKPNVSVTNCRPLMWGSDLLDGGDHIVTVATINGDVQSQNAWININSFMYDDSPFVIDPPVIQSPPHHSVLPSLGVIIGPLGALLAVLLLVLTIMSLRRRRLLERQRKLRQSAVWLKFDTKTPNQLNQA